MNRKAIYLDYNATTPVDPEVTAAMQPFASEIFGNPGSNHAFGRAARAAVDQAREQVAQALHAENPECIIFTSGATEANNLGLKGAARMLRHQGNHLISQATEHSSILGPLQALEKEGFEITLLQPDDQGRITAAQVETARRRETILVSVMYANNEIGTVQPIRQIGKLCRENNILFFCDAVQALGKIPVQVIDDQIDLLSLSGHKLYGPKGIGALYIAPRSPSLRLEPLVQGGGHERGLRSGTLPVPLIVGLGKACERAIALCTQECPRQEGLRNLLFRGLAKEVSGMQRNGSETEVLPNTLNCSFDGIDGEALFPEVTKALALSSGAACSTAKKESSHVLRALGIPENLARASLRFSLGRQTTAAEIDETIAIISQAVAALRR